MAVSVIQDGFQRNIQVIAIVFMGGIYPIRDRYKTDAVSREYLAEVAACFYVFASKAGEVSLC